MRDPNKKIKVAVGMSGGVDSAMTASLMIEKGYDVVGITMQIWDGTVNIPENARSGCYGPGEEKDIRDAESIAGRLGIRHHVIPLAEEYKKVVLDYYRSEYLCGRTPNPCVVCNRKIKFGALLAKAEKSGIGFDYFATGHYVRNIYDEKDKLHHLLKGVDPSKDQSYFLFSLGQGQLSKIIFPLGGYMKKDVVKMALDKGFSDIASKQESQDFIESEDHSPLFSSGEARPGPIVDTAGNVLGKHRGLIHYTIGQREGLGVATGGRIYVKEIRPESNTIVVAGKDEVTAKSCKVEEVKWVSGKAAPEAQINCQVRVRYRQKGVGAAVKPSAGKTAEVVFSEPQFAVTPGQAAVFYLGDEVLGGGFIA